MVVPIAPQLQMALWVLIANAFFSSETCVSQDDAFLQKHTVYGVSQYKKRLIGRVCLSPALSHSQPLPHWSSHTIQNRMLKTRQRRKRRNFSKLPVQCFVDSDAICVEPLIAILDISVQFLIKSTTNLHHRSQKRYPYAIDNDVNIHRQLEHKLNCFGKQH
ncbi:hypothetical protein OUZ56_016194 [Daphnia magna]|uniref:Secreted protein n=1 Tax=Daphnia magna TaxID=35525 RepID=A0ABR0APY4_9CRUS|nr:hypothetical protein OUZ56_016194 [Daphnia magna]